MLNISDRRFYLAPANSKFGNTIFAYFSCFSFYSQEQPEAVKAGIIFKCESPLTIWFEAGNEFLTIFQCKNSIQKVQVFFFPCIEYDSLTHTKDYRTIKHTNTHAKHWLFLVQHLISCSWKLEFFGNSLQEHKYILFNHTFNSVKRNLEVFFTSLAESLSKGERNLSSCKRKENAFTVHFTHSNLQFCKHAEYIFGKHCLFYHFFNLSAL